MNLALTGGRTRKAVAEALGVGLSSLTRWIGRYRGEETPRDIEDDLQGELRRLRKENALLKQELGISRKATLHNAYPAPLESPIQFEIAGQKVN